MGNIVVVSALGVAVRVHKVFLWMISGFKLHKVQVLFTHLPCRCVVDNFFLHNVKDIQSIVVSSLKEC